MSNLPSDLPSGWTTTTLGNCAIWYSGGTPSTSVAEYWGGDIPWITASSLHDFYVRDSERKVTKLGLQNGTRLMPQDAILFVVRGMSLKSEFRVGIARRPVAFGQDCKAIIAREGITPLFLANAIRAKRQEILSLVSEASHGTGRLETEALQRVEIPLPPLPIQRRIAEILGRLDAKIEVNRRINRTLEQMAQALYKHWFVDFGPFQAGAFVESELGLIPQGWRVGRMDELFLLQRGFDLPSQNRIPGAYPILSASGITGTHTEFKVKGPGVVTGRSGVIGQVFYVQDDFWPLNTSLWVREFRASSPLHAYHFLQNFDLQSFNSGSAVPTLNRNDIHQVLVIIPDPKIVQLFEQHTNGWFRLKDKIERENIKLSEIRDYLLPKLLSGEIPVEAAAATIEATSELIQ